MLFQLQQEPIWVELIPGEGERAAVEVLAAPARRAAKRAAHRSSGALLEGVDSDAAKQDFELLAQVGEAFGTSLLRARILDWRGIGDLDGVPVPFSAAALEAFLDDETLYEAAYAKLVTPELLKEAEKNGLSPSQNGTGAGATPENAIVGSPAKRRARHGAKGAPIAKAPSRRKKQSSSGT